MVQAAGAFAMLACGAELWHSPAPDMDGSWRKPRPRQPRVASPRAFRPECGSLALWLSRRLPWQAATTMNA